MAIWLASSLYRLVLDRENIRVESQLVLKIKLLKWLGKKLNGLG